MSDAFDRFAARASYYYGIDENQSADLLDALEAEGFEWGVNRLGNSHWGERAFELLAEEEIEGYDEPDSPYWLDGPDDEWLEADSEYEISAEYEEVP
jgi:hypothetical protein